MLKKSLKCQGFSEVWDCYDYYLSWLRCLKWESVCREVSGTNALPALAWSNQWLLWVGFPKDIRSTSNTSQRPAPKPFTQVFVSSPLFCRRGKWGSSSLRLGIQCLMHGAGQGALRIQDTCGAFPWWPVLVVCTWSSCSHLCVKLLALVNEIDSCLWFHWLCRRSGSCPCWCPLQHNSVMYLTSFAVPRKPGANQCLTSPDSLPSDPWVLM